MFPDQLFRIRVPTMALTRGPGAPPRRCIWIVPSRFNTAVYVAIIQSGETLKFFCKALERLKLFRLDRSAIMKSRLPRDQHNNLRVGHETAPPPYQRNSTQQQHHSQVKDNHKTRNKPTGARPAQLYTFGFHKGRPQRAPQLRRKSPKPTVGHRHRIQGFLCSSIGIPSISRLELW